MEPKAEDIQSIVADVACGLSTFCKERSSGSNEVFKNYSQLDFILGKLHLQHYEHVIIFHLRWVSCQRTQESPVSKQC